MVCAWQGEWNHFCSLWSKSTLVSAAAISSSSLHVPICCCPGEKWVFLCMSFLITSCQILPEFPLVDLFAGASWTYWSALMPTSPVHECKSCLSPSVFKWVPPKVWYHLSDATLLFVVILVESRSLSLQGFYQCHITTSERILGAADILQYWSSQRLVGGDLDVLGTKPVA